MNFTCKCFFSFFFWCGQVINHKHLYTPEAFWGDGKEGFYTLCWQIELSNNKVSQCKAAHFHYVYQTLLLKESENPEKSLYADNEAKHQDWIAWTLVFQGSDTAWLTWTVSADM